jgi:hypothetical protein
MSEMTCVGLREPHFEADVIVSAAQLRADAADAIAIVMAVRETLGGLESKFRRAAMALSTADARDAALSRYAQALSRCMGTAERLEGLNTAAEDMLDYRLGECEAQEAADSRMAGARI